MEDVVNALVGAALALLFALALLRASIGAILNNAHITIVIMVAIYLGAHLSNSAGGRQIAELGMVTAFIILSRILQTRWPAGVGVLIMMHGVYDLVLGPSSGIASWYPAFCGGFDIVAGMALVVIVVRKSQVEQQV